MGCNKSKIPDAEFDNVAPQGGTAAGDDSQQKSSRAQSHDKRMSAVLRSKRNGRGVIMGEKMDMSEAFEAKKIFKPPEVSQLITQVLSNTFPFSSLDASLLQIVVDAMESKQVRQGEQVITQGEQGDFFYLVETGNFTVIVNGMEVGTVSQAGTFGELALMHGAPRAATIRCNSGTANLWALDRNTFRRTLAMTTHQEIGNTMSTLQRVPQFERLTDTQLNKMAEAVEPVSFNAGDLIIEKGTAGSVFYIVKRGTVICKDIGTADRQLEDVMLSEGGFFGERALLLNEPRAANVYAQTAVECLIMDRQSFNEILGPLKELIDANMSLNVLASVPLLKGLTTNERNELVKCMVLRTYRNGEYIIRQHDKGNEFFIVKEGSVLVTQSVDANSEPRKIAELNQGDYFGEMALLQDDPRQANVVASGGGCEVFTLSRDDFTRLLGPLQNILERESQRRSSENTSSAGSRPSSAGLRPLQNISLNDLTQLATLGTGTFGKVKLVQHKQTKQTYALKIMKKGHIVAYKQQTNVISEKNVMVQAQHPFILQLVATMKDSTSLYMLIELCLGGELFNFLHCHPTRDVEYIPNNHARFYAACVLDAFEYLHAKMIVYRDLKPENLLIDSDGFIKVVDFGFAKVVEDRTYTLCGTPEYLAPELVLGKGHGKGVDYWALGVLIYEMLVGYSPFAGEEAPDQMVICRNILGGKYETPRQMSSAPAKDLVKKLLTKDANRRLGCMKGAAKDIKAHAWFSKFDWGQLLARKMEAPWIPPIKNATDTTHFDPYEEDDDEFSEPYHDDGSGWDDSF